MLACKTLVDATDAKKIHDPRTILLLDRERVRTRLINKPISLYIAVLAVADLSIHSHPAKVREWQAETNIADTK